MAAAEVFLLHQDSTKEVKNIEKVATRLNEKIVIIKCLNDKVDEMGSLSPHNSLIIE